jgi:hypothetical protein
MAVANEQRSASWHQFVSLTKRSKAHVVGLWLIVSRRIDRRPAARAESLKADVSTIGGLLILHWLTGQKYERAWMSDDDSSQWGAAHGLVVCAVAMVVFSGSLRPRTSRSRSDSVRRFS